MPLTRRKKRKGREGAIDEQTLKVDCPAAISSSFPEQLFLFSLRWNNKEKGEEEERRKKEGFFGLDWSLGWMPFSPSLFPNAAGRGRKEGKGKGGELAKKHELALSVLPLLFLSLSQPFFFLLFCLANSAMHTQAKNWRENLFFPYRTDKYLSKGVLTGGGGGGRRKNFRSH